MTYTVQRYKKIFTVCHGNLHHYTLRYMMCAPANVNLFEMAGFDIDEGVTNFCRI